MIAVASLATATGLAAAMGNPKILDYFQQPGKHLRLSRKTTIDRILDTGYPCEEHEVETEDGYFLKIYRIPSSPKFVSNSSLQHRPKVLLEHGLMGTSDTWILNGQDNSLPFLLADRGYDVWLGNVRGNLYARKHRSLSIHDGLFWRFSWHEIGFYDLPATIDYILKNITDPQEKSLHYVGHSQGTTIVTVLMSMREEYQQYLRTVNLWSPVIFLDNTENRLLKVLSPYMGYYNIITEKFSRQEFVPFNELFDQLKYSACQKESKLHGFCSPLALMVEGTFRNKNRTALELCLETHPGGISTEQFLHYMQAYPPRYPLERIHKLLHIWYSRGDQTVKPVDVQRFVAGMPAVITHRIADDNWSHGDYMFASNVRQKVNEPLIAVLDDYERNKK
ncbi:lipase 3-like [Musca vetustissima]|uniref:lipase 3-like n=1 Tax=Musca vetustissima TaxID=27455 RepID=UPI002AB73FF4|nr:lipase 3-like [Musca vetustissima]